MWLTLSVVFEFDWINRDIPQSGYDNHDYGIQRWVLFGCLARANMAFQAVHRRHEPKLPPIIPVIVT